MIIVQGEGEESRREVQVGAWRACHTLTHARGRVIVRDDARRTTLVIRRNQPKEIKSRRKLQGCRGEITKGAEWLLLSPINLYTNCEALRRWRVYLPVANSRNLGLPWGWGGRGGGVGHAGGPRAGNEDCFGEGLELGPQHGKCL